MTLCALCGMLAGDQELCWFHLYDSEGWAESNRIWCNFFHRGEVPVRLPQESREDRDEGPATVAYA